MMRRWKLIDEKIGKVERALGYKYAYAWEAEMNADEIRRLCIRVERLESDAAKKAAAESAARRSWWHC